MAIYDINNDGVIDAEDILAQTRNLKDLLNMEFNNDTDNILLHSIILKEINDKLNLLESKVDVLIKRGK